MNRPLVAILTLSLVLCTGLSRNAFARSLPDGARGRAIFRLQGGTLFRDRGYSDGDGWVAGGAFGFGVTRDLLVMGAMEHIGVNISQPYRESFQPVTLQFQLGAPFQHRIAPRVELGGGVYLRTRDRVFYGTYPYPYVAPRTSAPFGMNFGGGLSFLLARAVSLNLGVRRHESFNPNESWGMTTATAGMTFALSRDEPPQWARTDEAALASR